MANCRRGGRYFRNKGASVLCFLRITEIMKMSNHPQLEIGEIYNGTKDRSKGFGFSRYQASIYRYAENTWFVCSALTMPGWKEVDHRFYTIMEGDHRMIMYPHEWIAQFNGPERAWGWFDIMNKAVCLSNAEWQLKMIKERRKQRRKEPEDIKGKEPKEIIIDEIEEEPEPQAPEQGDLFGE